MAAITEIEAEGEPTDEQQRVEVRTTDGLVLVCFFMPSALIAMKATTMLTKSSAINFGMAAVLDGHKMEMRVSSLTNQAQKFSELQFSFLDFLLTSLVKWFWD